MAYLVTRCAGVALLLVTMAPHAAAQSTRRTTTLDPAKLARVSGTVVSDLTGEPLNRVRVYLKSLSGEASSLAVEADEHGSFVIANVVPGRYTITAQRDGYLPGSTPRSRGARLAEVLQLEAGQTERGLTFRLRPWSVIAGDVRFNDAEPAIGVLVQVFRDVYSKGRRTFAMVATTRTNDRGEYRMAGLRPGSYYVSASYDRPLSPEYVEQDALDESGRPLPQLRYSTTFYPSAQRLAEATHVRVPAMAEVTGIDIFLEPVRTVSIRGRMLSGLTGQAVKVPNLTLRRLSSDERSSINAAIAVSPRGDGFEMRGVAAGPYMLVADTVENGRRLFARMPLIVTDAPIEDLEVLLVPERQWRGTLRIADAPTLPANSLRLTLEPRSDLNPTVSVEVDPSGGFTANVVPDEVYDAYLSNAPDDLYVRSVRVANTEVDSEGIAGQQAAPAVPLEITVSARGGVLMGRAFGPDGKIAPGANVTVVPDPAYGRAHRYRSGYADQYGLFQIRGLAAGRYTAFAYYDEPPCELYDPDALETCRVSGANVSVAEGAQALTSVRVASVPAQ
jgi:hypothetical protein